jgi:hypothetical protein
MSCMKNWNDRKKDNKNNGKEVGSEDFIGDVKLLIEAAEDHIQVNEFCLYLKTIDNLRISSYNWSESKGLIIIISLKDAVPLGDMIRQMPLVGQVYKKKKKDITVMLNTSISETIPPVITASEGVVAA